MDGMPKTLPGIGLPGASIMGLCSGTLMFELAPETTLLPCMPPPVGVPFIPLNPGVTMPLTVPVMGRNDSACHSYQIRFDLGSVKRQM
jgi:hypothetical protein